MRTLLSSALTACTLAGITALSALSASAASHSAEVTLRVHHFMSAKASLHGGMLQTWADSLAEASDGRIAVELFPSMSLGGRPGDLYDQAADGAVDVILTLPGYTPGRFNQTEVFELPFLMEDPVATAGAFWDLVESDLQDGEYEDVEILAAWVHGPGVIHSEAPVTKLEDLKGVEMRGPTRLATDTIAELGATPVGMPLPAIPENLSKGVISATLLPWEITPSIRLAELVGNHTEIKGEKALYTATFILAMSPETYDDLPEDLRAIVDAQSGKALSMSAAAVQFAADAGGRTKAEANSFHAISGDELARWEAAAQPVYTRWIARAADEGFDGAALIERARKLIAANGE